MKEAAGEANMTVITIILIGVIAAIAIPLVNNAMKSTQKQACCNSAGGAWVGGSCTQLSSEGDRTYKTCLSETGGETE